MSHPPVRNSGLLSRSPQKLRCRPCLEPLEDRLVPVGQMFEIDGDALTQTTHDWDQVFNNTSGALDSVFLPDTANAFIGGQSTDLNDLPSWQYDSVERSVPNDSLLRGVPNNADLQDAFAAAYAEDGDVILYFGSDRLDTNGNVAVGFWFFQDPAVGLDGNGGFTGNHLVGDILVVMEFRVAGTASFAVYEWVGSGGSDGSLNQLLVTPNDATAVTNAMQTPSPWPYDSRDAPPGIFPPGGLVEGGINLTDLLDLPAGQGRHYLTFLAETRSSTSLNSTLQDFTLGRLEFNTLLPEPTKSIVATSEASTAGTDVTIGEIVRYRLEVKVPENSDLGIVQLVDALPAGLRFLNDGTARLAFVANGGGISSSTLSGAGLNVSGNGTNLAGITPTFVLPGSAIAGGPFASGTDVTFNLGRLANADRDADGEFLVLEFNALVDNNGTSPATSNDAGDVLPNTFTVNINGSPVAESPDAVTVTVVEPSITNVTKTASPTSGGIGDTITYTVTFSNTGGATAFDVVLTDALPPLVTRTGPVNVVPTGVVTGIDTSGTIGNFVQVNIASMAPGATVTVTYAVTLNATTTPGQVITNTAEVIYTSLPGTNGTPNNPTGSSPPGIPGSSTGERTGQGGINDYIDSDDAAVTITPGSSSNSISGFVYVDADNDGVKDPGEAGLPGIDVQLTGNAISVIVQTQADGSYLFPNLAPGTYAVSEPTQPAGFLDGRDTPGTPFGGTALPPPGDAISGIVIPSGGTVAGVNYNFGEIAGGTGSIGNFVWEDTNGNGRQDPGEPGLDGAKVVLTGTDDTGAPVSRTTTTAGGGLYRFTDLRPGTYQLRFTNPLLRFAGHVGYVFTVQDSPVANDSTDSDADPTTGLTAPFALGLGQSDQTRDAGVYRPANVGDFVWYDVNGNGIQDNGEPGIPGATVTVTYLGPNGVVGGDDQVFNTTTAADGIYHIPNLVPGNYTAAVTGLPAGLTVQTAGLPTFTLVSGQTRADVDFGFRGAGSLRGFVYRDLDNDGVFDPGETPVGSVRITLTGIDGLGKVVNRTTLTLPDGSYAFTDLAAGIYELTETQPAGLLDGQDTPGTPFGGISLPPDSILGIVIPGGGAVAGVNYNFGELVPQSLGNFVWADADGNGRQDPGEPGLEGVIVILTGSDDLGPVSITRITDAGGLYTFPNLRPGTYQLRAIAPAGYVFTVRNSPVATDFTDSDGPSGPNQTTIDVTLAPGETNLSYDAGLYIPASAGDLVWYDIDGDGIQDTGEPGLPNVTVTLTWLGPDGVPGGGDDQPFMRITDGNGLYHVDGLAPGNYTATLTNVPAGMTIATAARPTFDLVSGQNRDDVDFGFRGPGSIGDLVWHDLNNDGFSAGEPGIGGATVSVTWFGGDGVEGGTDDFTRTVITDANGNYRIDNLPLGEYRVSVDTATLPRLPAAAGPLAVGPFATYDLDSGTASPDSTTRVTLTTADPVEDGADFGYFYTLAFGDVVFLDFNGDGMQGPGDPGLAGVTLRATWAGNDGLLDAGGDDLTFTRTTGALGEYLFAGIPPGTYRVEVISGLPAGVVNTGDPDASKDGQTTFTIANNEFRLNIDFGYQGTGSLAGYVYRDFSVDGIRQPGPNPEDGIGGVEVTLNALLVGGTTFTRTTTTQPDGSYSFGNLPGGDYTITETQPPDVFTNGLNGFYNGLDTLGTLGGTNTARDDNLLAVTLGDDQDGVEYNFGENPPADPFGFVYIDLDQDGTREPGEPGIQGVAITVSGIAFAGTPLARPLVAADLPSGQLTVLTDANGRWEFPIMPPGTYSFVEAQPARFRDGAEEDADLNGPPATIGPDEFSNVLLNPFPVRGPFNFGELASSGSIGGSVYLDRNNNGFRNRGEMGIAGVVVTLIGTNIAGRRIVIRTTTNAQGNYRFTGLLPGTYSLIERQPRRYADGRDRAGTHGGVARNDVIAGILLGPNEAALAYLFGEQSISKRLFLSSMMAARHR